MIIDKLCEFLDGADATDAPSTNEVDLAAVSPGKGEPMKIHIQGTGVTASGDVAITLNGRATSGGADDPHAVITKTVAEINAGFDIYVPSDMDRYANLTFGTMTAGTIDAFLVLDSQDNPLTIS